MRFTVQVRISKIVRGKLQFGLGEPTYALVLLQNEGSVVPNLRQGSNRVLPLAGPLHFFVVDNLTLLNCAIQFLGDLDCAKFPQGRLSSRSRPSFLQLGKPRRSSLAFKRLVCKRWPRFGSLLVRGRRGRNGTARSSLRAPLSAWRLRVYVRSGQARILGSLSPSLVVTFTAPTRSWSLLLRLPGQQSQIWMRFSLLFHSMISLVPLLLVQWLRWRPLVSAVPRSESTVKLTSAKSS